MDHALSAYGPQLWKLENRTDFAYNLSYLNFIYSVSLNETPFLLPCAIIIVFLSFSSHFLSLFDSIVDRYSSRITVIFIFYFVVLILSVMIDCGNWDVGSHVDHALAAYRPQLWKMGNRTYFVYNLIIVLYYCKVAIASTFIFLAITI